MGGDQITKDSILRPNFMSHGTLGCKNLEKKENSMRHFLVWSVSAPAKIP